METEDEQQRLERVYRGYQTDQAVRSRRSSENPGSQANYRSWRHRLVRILKESGRYPLNDMRVLEVGCGSGDVVAGLTDWGAPDENLYGVDLRSDCIERAKNRFPNIDYRQGNGESLEFADGTFDLVLLITVFTSILEDSIKQNVAKEVARVLKPGGAVVWHDFRRDNPWNPNVKGVGRAEIRRLFPHFQLQLGTETLLPPLARRLGPTTPVLFPLLMSVPLLRTHLLGLLIKPE